MSNFNDIAAQFYTAGAKYSAAIQPYALKLFIGLLLIDILVTWIQFTAEGQLDSSHFLGRVIKHILSGGFVYLMIVNAFSWMNAVVWSFSGIGAAVTGLPALSPQTVLEIGSNMASTIFNAPATTSMVTNLELAIVQSVSAFIVLLAFVITAAMLLLTLIESYLVVGGGVILLGLGANRFTAPAAEGYFGYVIRVGVRLLFFYLVLAIGVQMANQWSAELTAACKPVPATLPWWTTYGVPPSSIMTTVCSGSLPVADMLTYTAFAIVFMIVSVAVPHTAASIAGGTVGLALNHAFEAAFIAQTVIRPITSALQTGFNKVSQLGTGSGDKATEGAGWVSAITFGQQTQKLSNLDPDGGQRVPAPKDVRATSVIPARAPSTTPMNSGTTPIAGSNGTKGIGKETTSL
ncbi:MAG: P-type conjugative transfer protein TrbL [Candidatus Binataceae bacterium]|nr:P-type conjugative transfer protein TrbL [Candidatus Binataceae bacterium]